MAKKILFIEDESALQRAVTKALTDEGYEVFSALDGEAGLGIAKKELPDLILLDLILPKKDGFAVLEELKKEPATNRIPVIILSNLSENEDIVRAMELGATTYLVKTSYRLPEVIEKVQEALKNSPPQSQKWL